MLAWLTAAVTGDGHFWAIEEALIYVDAGVDFSPKLREMRAALVWPRPNRLGQHGILEAKQALLVARNGPVS